MNATYAVRCYLSILLIAKFMDSRFWRLAVIAEKLNFLPICVNSIPRVSETRDPVHFNDHNLLHISWFSKHNI